MATPHDIHIYIYIYQSGRIDTKEDASIFLDDGPQTKTPAVTRPAGRLGASINPRTETLNPKPPNPRRRLKALGA